MPQRASTITAGAVAPQSIGGERTSLGDRSDAANAATPASAGYARPPGRPVPKVGGGTASTGVTPQRTSATVSNVPMASTEPATAREACGNRTFLALAACMDRRCEEPRFRSSSECVPILVRKASREGQASN